MIILHGDQTGLPVNIWVDNSRWYKKFGSRKYIKFQGNYSSYDNPSNLVTLTISKNPEIVLGSNRLSISEKSLGRVKRFVINNEKLLSDLADEEITCNEFLDKMIWCRNGLPELVEQRHRDSYLLWFGSQNKNLKHLETNANMPEPSPLAFISNSFEYSKKYARNGVMYLLRAVTDIFIWNPLSDLDWFILILNEPAFDRPEMREYLKNKYWLNYSELPFGINYTRNDLLGLIESLGYDGVIDNGIKGQYALGVFNHSANDFVIIRKYIWESKKQRWYDRRVKQYIAE